MDPFASLENLEQLRVYQLARELSALVWSVVMRWNYLAQKTVGDQWIRSTDSISANVAEGYGRYFFNDTIKFYYYSRGSHFESHDWFSKAVERKLLTEQEADQYSSIAIQIPRELNLLIKRTRINALNFNSINKSNKLINE